MPWGNTEVSRPCPHGSCHRVCGTDPHTPSRGPSAPASGTLGTYGQMSLDGAGTSFWMEAGGPRLPPDGPPARRPPLPPPALSLGPPGLAAPGPSVSLTARALGLPLPPSAPSTCLQPAATFWRLPSKSCAHRPASETGVTRSPCGGRSAVFPTEPGPCLPPHTRFETASWSESAELRVPHLSAGHTSPPPPRAMRLPRGGQGSCIFPLAPPSFLFLQNKNGFSRTAAALCPEDCPFSRGRDVRLRLPAPWPVGVVKCPGPPTCSLLVATSRSCRETRRPRAWRLGSGWLALGPSPDTVHAGCRHPRHVLQGLGGPRCSRILPEPSTRPGN